MAKGSLTELQNQLLVARDVGYVSGENFSEIAAQSKTALSLLAGLIRSTTEHDRRKV
jgi:four helix bundle protein